MKSTVLVFFMSLMIMTGCTTGSKKANNYTYTEDSSVAKNLMHLASPIPWDLNDANVALPEAYVKGKDYYFESSLALMGASKDMSSIGSVIKGGTGMGALALMMPEIPTASARTWTFMVVEASLVDSFSKDDMIDDAFKYFIKTNFNIIKNNISQVEREYYGSNITSLDQDIQFNSRAIFGDSALMSFKGMPAESLNGRDCPGNCTVRAYKDRLSVLGPYNTKINGIKETNGKYYILSYRNLMSSNKLLIIDKYNEYYPDNFFYYTRGFKFNPEQKLGVPAVFSRKKVNLFVKPNNSVVGRVQ